LVLRKNIPSTASVVSEKSDGCLHSPAAERNSAHIIDLVCNYAPVSGNALEIASGTGQHIVELAAAVPDLIWQPSDIDETRLNSITSRSLAKQLPNLLPPIRLDVTDKGWSAFCPNQDFILLVNLLHLVSAADQAFHQSLIEADPDIGYKDDAWMLDLFSQHKLELIKIVEMPANNLAFVAEKSCA
jgi:hypothetical protein